MNAQTWDPDLYDDRHAFVTALGAGVLDLLAAQPGERVLDLGCGTGDHVAQLRAAGVDTHGVDASPTMIDRARKKFPGLPFEVGDARELGYFAEFDAVMSNATLHWVPEAGAAARSVARALRPGGRFVVELGGAGNIATITTAAMSLRREVGADDVVSPWYFPSVGDYSQLLEAAGFEVVHAWLFDRPTPLEGEDGLANWVRMFDEHLLLGVPDQDAFFVELYRLLRPHLYREGSWWADYRRLRVRAVLPSPTP